MSTIELTLYNFVKKEFNLSEEKALKFIEVLEEMHEAKSKQISEEYQSIFKNDFYKLDVKIEQSKSDMIKWFFAFFITLVLMILGLFATILLK